MSKPKIVQLPAHVTGSSSGIMPPYDSCFVPMGFLFPESRAELTPYREFPLSEPLYALTEATSDRSMDDLFADSSPSSVDNSAFDSTILQITETDEILLDVQGMGMQYTLHTQMCLRHDLAYQFPKTWDRNQSLMVNIPVFSEEQCKYYYPISTMGYNVGNTTPPMDIDIAHNYPQMFGYLPNGDLILYWEIAQILSQEFNLELEPIRSTVEGTLIVMPNISEQIKVLAPNCQSTETGIIVPPGADCESAVNFARQWLGREPCVYRASLYHFSRLILPVIHSELDLNAYADATWGAFGFTSQRLTGFDFKINNNPFTRDSAIFSTERGNIVVSNAFFSRLCELIMQFGGSVPMQAFPVQRLQ